MNILIVGVGKIGDTLIKDIIKEKHDIVLIDTDSKILEHAVNKYDVKGVVGGACDKQTLIEAGVANADFFICCTPQDEVNILACVIAKKYGAKYTIARVRDQNYFKELNSLKEDLGISYVFNPEYRTALEIIQILKFPFAVKVDDFANGKAKMIELKVEKGNPIIDKSIVEIIREYGNRVLFSMVLRGEEMFIPKGNFVVKEGDFICLISSEEGIYDFTKKLKIYKHRSKSVFIIGGGKIGQYLAQKLTDSSVAVKILETNKKRCEELSEILDNVEIINGDGTNKEILTSENLKKYDSCVTLTGMDEENVIISMYAKQLEINKVITKIDRASVEDMTGQLGLDTVVSPQKVISGHIIKFIRQHLSYSVSGINSLYTMADKAELIEFTLKEDFLYKDIAVRDLKIKDNVLIGGVVRNGEFILPTGDTKLCTGDRVIIVALANIITDLMQIFK